MGLIQSVDLVHLVMKEKRKNAFNHGPIGM